MTDFYGPLQRGCRLLGILGLLLWAPGAAAQVILDAVPGGLVEIPLASADRARPQAFFGQRRILVLEFGDRWAGLIGLPLSLVPGRYVIQVKLKGNEKMEAREFTVYPRRRNQQSAAPLPGPPPEVLERALRWRDTLDAELPLDAPVPHPADPLFGDYRRSTGSGSERINYVAFRIKSGAPVRAPDAGRVAAIAGHETGIYIWIDHGMGLFTCIGPVARTTLRQSDPVTAGQVIGRVIPEDEASPGALYLLVFLNGAAINPFLIADIEEDSTPQSPDR